MKELPEGQTQEIEDPNTGEIYTIRGLKSEDPDIKTIQSYNDAGELTITSYRLNPDGTFDIINQQTGGKIGKTKTQASSITLQLNQQQQGALGDASTRLEASRGADGYYNTEAYNEERNKFIQVTGKPDLFDQTFKQKLNPNDPSAKRFLTKSEIDIASEGGLTENDKQQLRNMGVSEEMIEAADAAGLSLADLLQ